MEPELGQHGEERYHVAGRHGALDAVVLPDLAAHTLLSARFVLPEVDTWYRTRAKLAPLAGRATFVSPASVERRSAASRTDLSEALLRALEAAVQFQDCCAPRNRVQASVRVHEALVLTEELVSVGLRTTVAQERASVLMVAMCLRQRGPAEGAIESARTEARLVLSVCNSKACAEKGRELARPFALRFAEHVEHARVRGVLNIVRLERGAGAHPCGSARNVPLQCVEVAVPARRGLQRLTQRSAALAAERYAEGGVGPGVQRAEHVVAGSARHVDVAATRSADGDWLAARARRRIRAAAAVDRAAPTVRRRRRWRAMSGDRNKVVFTRRGHVSPYWPMADVVARGGIRRLRVPR
eukprot:6209139-Prymnesium_polylepis.1